VKILKAGGKRGMYGRKLRSASEAGPVRALRQAQPMRVN
jgi:hypothetical protein